MFHQQISALLLRTEADRPVLYLCSNPIAGKVCGQLSLKLSLFTR
jgi:hypothetical protein